MENSFELYGMHSRQFSGITKQETKRLLEEGTKESLNKVFENNLRLVSYVIEKQFYKAPDKEELFQVGSIGLWKAVLYFDLSMNTEFTTYAVALIEGEIKHSIRYNNNLKISRNIMELSHKVFKIKEEYSKNHNGREITSKELSEILMVSIDEIEEAINSKRDLLSIDEPAYNNDSDSEIYLKDVIADNNQMIDDVLYDDYLNTLTEMINNLDERDKMIVKCLYGIGEEKKTQTDIASIFNISQAQVSRIGMKFQKDYKKAIGIIENKKENIENKKMVIKQEKVTKTQTIYEILNRFNKKDIDTIIDKLPIEQQEILLMMYPKTFTDEIIELNLNVRTKAKRFLNNVIYKLALLEVEGSSLAVNDSNDIALNRKENVIMKKANLNGVIANNMDVSNDKKIYLTKKLQTLFPDISENDIYCVMGNLPPRQKEIFGLSYGIYDNIPLSNQDIVIKLGLTEKNVTQQLYYARKKLKEQLLKTSDKIVNENNEISDDLSKEILENEDYEEVSDIAKIIDQIRKGKFGYESKTYKCLSNKICVEVTSGDCLISSVDANKCIIDESTALVKKCYIYRLKRYDENGKLINENIILRDKNIKKYYNMLMQDRNKNYIFSNVQNGEIICYKIKKEEKISNDETISKKEKNNSKVSLNQYVRSSYDEAMDALKEKNLSLAETKFTKLLSIVNDDDICFNANVNLAEIYKKKNKPFLAEKHYKQALAIREDYLTLVRLGIVLYKQKKYNEALSYFDECDKICYWKTNHLVEKAKTLYLMGNSQAALAELDDCISNHENYYQPHYEKAIILFEQNMYKEALEEIKKCDEIKPNENSHMVIKGKIKYLNKEEKEAFEIFDKCVINDNKRNIMYSIIDIGYFFHQRDEKELCYKYYSQTPMFPKWINLTEQEIIKHFEKHKNNSANEKMHSVFNVDIKLNDLQNIVNNMPKTSLKQLYDVYQVYWPNVGYMQVDEENVISENYLTIFTLPFSKKIMMCYPDSKFEGKVINEPVPIDLMYEKGLVISVEKQTNKNEDATSLQENEKQTNILGLKDNFDDNTIMNVSILKGNEIKDIMNSVYLEVQNEVENNSTESLNEDCEEDKSKNEEYTSVYSDTETNSIEDSNTSTEPAKDNNNSNENNNFSQSDEEINAIENYNKDEQLDYLKMYEIFQDVLSDNIIKELDRKEFIIVMLKLNYGPHSNKEIAEFLSIDQKEVDDAINNYFVKLKQRALSIVNSAFDKFIDDSSMIDDIALKYKR